MKFNGSCHCGSVQFEADANIENVNACNCSMCHRKGTLLTFIPATSFDLVKGESNLTNYQFHKKQIHHLFCKTCGVTSFAQGAMPDGTKMIALNVRCLEGFDIDSVPTNKIDGKSF